LFDEQVNSEESRLRYAFAEREAANCLTSRATRHCADRHRRGDRRRHNGGGMR
jgi:hypothetical protein